jgi:hypothetical protein
MATDRAGHATTSAPLTITVDNTPPIISVISPTANQFVRGATPLSGSIADPHHSQYEIDLGVGAAPTSWTPLVTQTPSTTTVTDLGSVDWTGKQPGIYTLRITAADAVSNSAASTITVQYQPYVPGDVNHDGKINVSDAILMLGMTVGTSTAGDASLGDVAPVPGTGGRAYGDGKITITDVVRVLRRALGLEPDPWPAASG